MDCPLLADIAAEQGEHRRVALDEGRAGRAARERLQPDRARAGEDIEEGRAFKRRVDPGMDEAVERRLAHPFGGRAHGTVRRHSKPPPAPAPPDDADHDPVPAMG